MESAPADINRQWDTHEYVRLADTASPPEADARSVPRKRPGPGGSLPRARSCLPGAGPGSRVDRYLRFGFALISTAGMGKHFTSP
jgi:hypothetical protein